MFRTFLVVTSLIAVNAATATTTVEQSTVTNNETAMPVAAAGKSWTVISMENSKQTAFSRLITL